VLERSALEPPFVAVQRGQPLARIGQADAEPAPGAAVRAAAVVLHAQYQLAVFRARGDRAIFPIMPGQAITDATLPVILGGDAAATAAALTGVGVPATAVTAPVFVDFDGGGYRAPFAP